MKIIGITGTSGAGKTTVSNLIKKMYDAEIIDADKIAKSLSNDSNSEYFKEIINLFGKSALQEDNKLNRRKIAEIIYNDEEKRQKLNLLTFKYVTKEIEIMLIKLKNDTTLKYICIDVPLLYESGMENLCDSVIAVIAEKENKISRICARDNINEELAKQRLKIQNNNQFFIDKANFVIKNNNTIKELEKNIKEIMSKI